MMAVAMSPQASERESVLSTLGGVTDIRSTTGTVETSATRKKKKKRRRRKREGGPTLIAGHTFRLLGEDQELFKSGGQKDPRNSRRRKKRGSRSEKSSRAVSRAASIVEDNKSTTGPGKAMIKYEKSARRKKVDEVARKLDPLRYQAIRQPKVTPGEEKSKATEDKGNGEAVVETKEGEKSPAPMVHVPLKHEPVKRARRRRRRYRKRENFGGTMVVSHEDHVAESQKQYFHMTTITIKMNLVELYGKKEIMDDNPHEMWKNCKALQIPMNKYNLYIEDTLRNKHGLPELAFRLKDHLNAPYKKQSSHSNVPAFTVAS